MRRVLAAALVRLPPLGAPRLPPLAFHDAQPPRCNGEAGFAREATRLHLPILRDLRRHRISVGLWSAWRRAQKEPQGSLVARDGARTERHRGTRRGDPDASARLGSEWARQRIRRSAGGLQEL